MTGDERPEEPTQQQTGPSAGSDGGGVGPDGTSAAYPRSAARWQFPWLSVICIVCGLAIFAVASYSIALSLMLRSSAQAYSQGDYDRAIAKAQQYDRYALFERHRGRFNAGTAFAAEGDLDQGEENLRIALERTPVRDECVIRQNLALVLEARGLKEQEAGNDDAADELLDEAIQTSQDSPEACRPPDGQQDESQSEDEKRMEEEKDPQQKQSQDPEEQSTGQPTDGTEQPTDGQSQPGPSGEPTDGESQNSQTGEPTDSQSSESGEDSDGNQEKQSSGGDSRSGEGGSKRDKLNERNRDAQKRLNEDSEENGKGGGMADQPW